MMNHFHWRTNNPGGRNPFLRLVRRHTNLATIMRVIEPATSRQTVSPISENAQSAYTQNEPAKQPAKAFILPPGTSLPEGTITEFLPPADIASINIAPASTGLSDVRHARPRVAQRDPAAHQRATPSNAHPPIPPSRPTVATPAETTGSINDTTWNRLQTIYRLHQENEATDETTDGAINQSSAEANDTPEAGSGESAAHLSQIVQTKSDDAGEQPRTTGIATVVQPSMPDASQAPDQTATGMGPSKATTTSESQKRKTKETTQPKREDKSRISEPAADTSARIEPEYTAQSAPPTEAPPFEESTQLTPADPNPDEKSLHPEKVIRQSRLHRETQPSELTSPIDHDRIRAERTEPPVSTSPVQATHARPAETADANELEIERETSIESTGPAMQSEPLQAVWPVQYRTDTAPVKPPTSKEVPQTRFETNQETAKTLQGKEEHAPALSEASRAETIEGALRQVKSGQPTDSSIELIPPRRPRPTKAPPVQRFSTPDRQVAPDDRRGVPSQETSPTDFIPMDTPPTSSIPEGEPPNQVYPPEDEPIQTDSSQPPTTSNIQTAREPVPGGPDSNELVPSELAPSELVPSELVHTEIGPLPSDLWNLIGQSPPDSDAASTTIPTSEPMAAASGDSHAAERTGIRPSTKSDLKAAPGKPSADEAATVIENPMAPSPTTLQRQPAEHASTAAEETTTAETPEEEASEMEQEAKINELARKVYDEIKRRLTLEWERARRM